MVVQNKSARAQDNLLRAVLNYSTRSPRVELSQARTLASLAPRPFNDEFRVFAPEGFGDVAIPAHREAFAE